MVEDAARKDFGCETRSLPRIADLIHAHLNGETSELEERDLLVHLATCAACQERYDLLRDADGALRTVFESASSPRELPDELKRMIREIRGDT